jgi:hypothetical protein
VLAHLGIRSNGGAHSHISRQLRRLDIDTSHFRVKAKRQTGVSTNRLSPPLILRQLPPGTGRTPGFRLRRAMLESGMSEQCAQCGIGSSWNGESLTLHLDHINGDFLDNRSDNLRFLCPNCHSQTPTYSGRNRQVLGRTLGMASQSNGGHDGLGGAAPQDAVVDTLMRFNWGELTAAQAATEIGCNPNHVFVMRKRLIQDGVMAADVRARIRAAQRDAVIAFALENPGRGYRAISAALREGTGRHMIIGHDQVRTILTEAGLNTPWARRSAAHRSRSLEV